MAYQPISTKHEVKFRGPSSSEDYNQWVEETFYDINKLFNIAAEHGLKIPANMEALVIENLFLQKQISELADQYEALNKTMTDLDGNNHLIVSFQDTQVFDPVDDYKELEQKVEYGVLRVKSNQETSKIYLSGTGGNLVPKSLQVNLYEDIAPFDVSLNMVSAPLIDDSGLLNAFDGSMDSFWMRRAEHLTETDEIYFCVEILLPQNIINHTRANSIYFDPIPLGSFDILDIQYKSTTAWNRIPNYPTTAGQPDAIQNISQQEISFPMRDIVAVRIYGKQNNWLLRNGKHHFYYGFRGIDVVYSSYEVQESRNRIAINILDNTKSFESIESIIPIFAEGSFQGIDKEDLFSLHTILVEGIEYSLGETLPILTKSVELELGLSLLTDSSPLLTGIEVVYKQV